MRYLVALICMVVGCKALSGSPQAATLDLPKASACGCVDCQCQAGECGGQGCPTLVPEAIEVQPKPKPVSVLVPSPAEPAKQDATKQEAKPAPTNTASQLQTSVRQQINAEPRYEYRTESYGFRGRRQRTVKVLVGGDETQSAPVYYGGSMCGPNGCN